MKTEGKNMEEKRKGMVIFAGAIFSIGLLLAAQGAKAADGDLNAAGLVLKDANANGKIDEVRITVDYAVGVANAIIHATDAATTIGMFTITDSTTNNPVTVNSVDFVSGNGTVAIFKLALSEADIDLSVNTSATALNVVYDAANTNLKITNGTAPVGVATIASGAMEKDGVAPVAISASYKDVNFDGMVDRIDIVYSENISGSSFNASEWSFPTNPHALIISSGSFSTTDLRITVTGAPAGNTALNTTTIKYTTGTGITDGINPAVSSATLSLGDKAQPVILTAQDQSAHTLDGATGIPANANIIINFSEPMDVATLDVPSEWTISPNPGSWAVPVWSNSNKTVTLSHTSTFTSGSVETVTLASPSAVSGVLAGDKALKNAPSASAVNNPFSFTVAGTVVVPSSDVSPYWSMLSASPSVIIIVDSGSTASETVSVTVVAKNSVGAVLSDKSVSITSSRGLADTITPASATTGSNGVASFAVKSSVAGKSVITATAGGVVINQRGYITFLPVGSTIGNPTTPNENSVVILYRVLGDHRVYVIKNKKKHWIKSPKEFEDKGYDWKKIQDISAQLLAKYPDAEPMITDLLRAIGDKKVYNIKDGKKYWIRTAEEFNAARLDWSKIKDVTQEELAAYSDEELADAMVKIVNAMNLRVRSADSAAGSVLDTVKQSEVYTIIEKKNGWYKIKTKKGKTGWVSGKYAKEEKED